MGEFAPFMMVIMIVLIVTVGRIYSAKHGIDTSRSGRRMRREGLMDVHDHQSNAEAERLRHEVTRLNERIQVLERLATDPAKRLSAEIDALDDRKH
ncbi:hypothetical protein KX816_20560 [Sphingosinicellaceae bacterium]|nr:hypothetical protein KX816_20560 [Sphingosinicellaceae bacterium]